MTKIIINGGKKLQGTLPVFGAKNACLPIICAAALANENVTLSNIPNLKDIHILSDLLKETGCQVNLDISARTLDINPNITNHIIGQTANQMRASILLMAPLLAKKGEVKIPYPGGCSIGGRPIDITIDGLKALGAKFYDNDDYLIASTDGFIGTEFRLHFPSVGGTQALIMAGACAKGQTTLHNIAKEPEVIDLIKFLNSMGAKIELSGQSSVIINGVEKLNGCTHNIMPDRIITGTYSVLAALCAGKEGILIKNCNPSDLKTELDVLAESGVKMDISEDSIFIPEQTNEFTGTDFETNVYDGFATDLQSPFMLFMTQTKGEIHVTENIYENRFMHIEHLNNMGANITAVSKHIAVVKGKTDLSGKTVTSTDLRASAALVIAGLIATGQTIIEDVRHLDRGYETLDTFLNQLGADTTRVES